MEYGIKERLLISYQELSNPTLCDQTIIDNLSKSVLELYNIPETLFSLFSLFEETIRCQKAPHKMQCSSLRSISDVLTRNAHKVSRAFGMNLQSQGGN